MSFFFPARSQSLCFLLFLSLFLLLLFFTVLVFSFYQLIYFPFSPLFQIVLVFFLLSFFVSFISPPFLTLLFLSVTISPFHLTVLVLFCTYRHPFSSRSHCPCCLLFLSFSLSSLFICPRCPLYSPPRKRALRRGDWTPLKGPPGIWICNATSISSFHLAPCWSCVQCSNLTILNCFGSRSLTSTLFLAFPVACLAVVGESLGSIELLLCEC